MTDKYEIIGKNYKKISEIPRDKNIFYKCTECGGIISSVPKGNIGCECRNIFIDKDYGRLIVDDFSKIEVIKKSK